MSLASAILCREHPVRLAGKSVQEFRQILWDRNRSLFIIFWRESCFALSADPKGGVVGIGQFDIRPSEEAEFLLAHSCQKEGGEHSVLECVTLCEDPI